MAGSGRPGPVYLELPVDVLNAQTDPASVKRTHSVVHSHPADLDQCRKIIELLQQATQPIVIAGSGAWYSDAGQELIAFVEKTGIPAFTSTLGRGTISDTHPLCFESSLAIRPGAALFANMNADLVLFLGTRMSLFYIFGDLFNQEAKFIQVDIEAEEIGRNRSVDLPVVSDIQGLLAVCNRLIDEKNLGSGFQKRFEDWVSALRKAGEAGKARPRPSGKVPHPHPSLTSYGRDQ